MQGLLDTKKARDGFQRVPLMMGIGAAKFVNDVTLIEIRSAASVLRTIAEANTYALKDRQVPVSSVVPKPSSKATAKEIVAIPN